MDFIEYGLTIPINSLDNKLEVRLASERLKYEFRRCKRENFPLYKKKIKVRYLPKVNRFYWYIQVPIRFTKYSRPVIH